MKRLVKIGNVVVPIYELKAGRYSVIYRERGKRIEKRRKTLAKAKAVAEEAAFRILRGQETAISGFKRIGIGEIVEEFLAFKATLKLSPKYQRSLAGDLRPFARAFSNCRFEEIDALSISKYLGGLRVGDRRRNNIRDAIVTLSLFAKKFNFLRGDLITEAEKVPRISLEHGSPKIYMPEQLQIMLGLVLPEWLDWIVLGAFAGIRPEESGLPHFDRQKREWIKLNYREHFLWPDRQILIPAVISKTGRNRFITMNETLLAWIGYRPIDANVCERNIPKDRKRMFAKPLPFEWINDGLRHSYASYWQSIHSNMARMKEEMGNSEAINRRFYYNPQPKSIALRWFAILPKDSGNIIALPKTA